MNAEEETENWEPQHWSRHEWFYMWTKGLDPRRIARICRVPYRKVYDHIRTRVNHNPALFGQRLMLHDHPKIPRGGLGNRRSTWQDRAFELADFRRTHGRFPRGYLEGEKQLYSFLQHQRKRYRLGQLAAYRVSFLNENLPGWLTPPKQDRETKLWARRAAELKLFVRDHARYPSYKSGKNVAEKVLATWLTRQRRCHRLGTLPEFRRASLDQAVPGWHVTGVRSAGSDAGPTTAKLR